MPIYDINDKVQQEVFNMSININNRNKYSNQTEVSTSRTAGQLSATQSSDGTSENNTVSFQESMQAFKERALDQIKNGEPTYQIGASEMSIREWDKLMDKVDKDIDSIKEEQKERLEKEEEERKEKELLEEAQTKIEETDHSELDETAIDKLFQESSIL